MQRSTPFTQRVRSFAGAGQKLVAAGAPHMRQFAPRRTLASNATSRAPAKRVLVTGGLGQIGTELVPFLRQRYGPENVVSGDVRKPEAGSEGPFAYLDVLNLSDLERVIVEHRVDWMVHNVSILSAKGELNPSLALEVNVTGLHNVLEAARRHNLRVFVPSSIAAFGPSTPRDNTPDVTIQQPNTIYGVTKVYGELLGAYYNKKFDLDFRALRYPGVISSVAPPGGGTTDYAVDIFYKALQTREFRCFLRDDSMLPMMYMPDCLAATVQLLEADAPLLKQRTYNVAAISFTPKELTASIRRHIPDLRVTYSPDFRQAIADSWPRSLDDSAARRDWGWSPEFDLDKMVDDMLAKLRIKLQL